MPDLKADLKRWQETTLKRTLDRSPERKSAFTTESGIPVKALYTPLDNPETDYQEQIGFPGEYPYTRGVYPSMYRGQFWTMRQYAGFGAAEETNQRFRYLLERGSTGLSIAFDLPTQLGWIPTIRSPRARWAAWASPWIPSPTWKRYSGHPAGTAFPPR